MYYRTEEPKDKQNYEDDTDGEMSSEIEVDESEALDKISQTEDMILKDVAAK